MDDAKVQLSNSFETIIAVVPSPSANAPQNNIGNEWDFDDDDDFPVGLFIALLAALALFVFKKSRDSRSSNTDPRNCSGGGYQPVRRSEHNKRW